MLGCSRLGVLGLQADFLAWLQRLVGGESDEGQLAESEGYVPGLDESEGSIPGSAFAGLDEEKGSVLGPLER